MQVGNRLFLGQTMDGWNQNLEPNSQMLSRICVLPLLTFQQELKDLYPMVRIFLNCWWRIVFTD